MTCTVLKNAKFATMVSGGLSYGLIEKGAVAISDGLIQWVGPEKE